MKTHNYSIGTKKAVYVEGSVNGRKTPILVDTGSAVTILHKDVWNGVGGQLRPTDIPVVVANGEPLNVLGATAVEIDIAGSRFSQEVLVTEDISQNLLLGSDFLVSNGFIIDFSEGLLWFNNSVAKLQVAATRTTSVCHLSIGSPTVSRGREEKLLWADLREPHHGDTHAGMVVAKEGFEEQHHVLFARVVAVPRDGKVPVRIANLSSSATTLYEGQRIGSFHPLATPDTNISDAEYREIPPMCLPADVLRVHSTAQGSGECSSQRPTVGADTLDQDQHEQFDNLPAEFSDVFSKGKQDLARTSLVYHRINTGDASPIKQAPRRLPFHRHKEVSQLLEDMQGQGVIQPSQSPWAAPIVLVQKKDGSIRFCVDYRKLNQTTKKDSYPLPRVDDLLDALSDARWFSTLDLASGYWQVELDPADREKTAFTTSHGLYEFRVMPFGLCNAPSTFQRLMELVLAGLSWESCLAYMDDIVIFGRTFDEHVERLREVLSRLREANLKVNARKCQFSGLGEAHFHVSGQTILLGLHCTTYPPPTVTIKRLNSENSKTSHKVLLVQN